MTSNSNQPYILASSSFLIIALAVIVPTWYITTTVERNPLPYSSISSLPSKYSTEFEICTDVKSAELIEKEFSSDWLRVKTRPIVSTGGSNGSCNFKITKNSKINEIQFTDLSVIEVPENSSIQEILNFLQNSKMFIKNDKINVKLEQTIIVSLLTQNTFNFEELNQIQLHLSNYLNAIYNNLIKFNIIIEVLNFSSENFDKFNIETSFNYLESNILSPDSDRNSAHLAVVLGASSSSETSESQENQEIERYSIKNWGNLLFLNDIKNTKNLGQLTNKMLIEFFNLELGSEISSKSDLFALHNQILISNNINSFENAVKNTKSLLSMLEKVKSIVINKSVAEKVDLAVRLLTAKTTEKGASNPSTSRLKIYENYLNANELITLANTDDSLLGLLYFPEDQKIGIYVPLFLPCGLSLLGAAKVLFHYFKDYRASLLVKAKVE